MHFDSEMVLQRRMDDGSFDDIRKEVVKQIKQHEGLNRVVEQKLLQSKALKKASRKSKVSKKS